MIFLQLFLDCLVGFLVPDRLLMIYIIFQNLIDTEYKGKKSALLKHSCVFERTKEAF
jgi:hypothetical protein